MFPWGSTNMKLNNGQVLSIPKQMLQAQHSQVLFSYKQHCDIVGIDPLSDRTIYSILSSLNASKQRFISGINEFVKYASEAWLLLEKIVRQLHIPYATTNDLFDSMEKNKIYLKTRYGCQCGTLAEATTHCTIFALSQPNDLFYTQSCDHDHSCYCTGINDKQISF